MRAVVMLPGQAQPIPLPESAKVGFAQAPLAVPLDQPWCVAEALGSNLAAADGRWPEAISGPVMFVGARA